MNETLTFAQSTGWSSVTVTCQVTVSPQWNGVPPCGAGSVVRATTGALLPTTTGTDAEAERPVLSVTFSVAS